MWRIVPHVKRWRLPTRDTSDAARTAAEIAFERVSRPFRHLHRQRPRGVRLTSTWLRATRAAAWEAYETAREHTGMDPSWRQCTSGRRLAPLACGDLAAARRWADDVVSSTKGWSLARALTSRARVEIAQGELDAAERDAYDALDLAAQPRAVTCLFRSRSTASPLWRLEADNHLLATRLFGAADAAHRHMGMVRFKVLDAGDEATDHCASGRFGRRTILTPHGPRVRRCRSRKPSPTRYAVAVNVNAPAAGGRRSPAPSSTW